MTRRDINNELYGIDQKDIQKDFDNRNGCCDCCRLHTCSRLELHVDPSNILSDTFTTYSSTGYVKVKKVSGATKYQVRAESTPAESKSTKITGVVFKNARRSLAAAKGTKKIYVYAMMP